MKIEVTPEQYTALNELMNEIVRGEVLALQERIAFAMSKGWVVKSTSCSCGGSLAFMKPRESGAWEMVGCVCHHEHPRPLPPYCIDGTSCRMPSSCAEYGCQVKAVKP